MEASEQPTAPYLDAVVADAFRGPARYHVPGASYPPGVPALLPGERISAETVAYLRELADSGARLHGASDPAFKTINVLSNGRPDAGPPNSERGPDASRR